MQPVQFRTKTDSDDAPRKTLQFVSRSTWTWSQWSGTKSSQPSQSAMSNGWPAIFPGSLASFSSFLFLNV